VKHHWKGIARLWRDV
jgi:hypothetical protein